MCPSKEDTKSIPLSCCYVRRSNAMVRIPLCCTCKQEAMLPYVNSCPDHADHQLDDLICQKSYTP
jgi:hypothetical protein